MNLCVYSEIIALECIAAKHDLYTMYMYVMYANEHVYPESVVVVVSLGALLI